MSSKFPLEISNESMDSIGLIEGDTLSLCLSSSWYSGRILFIPGVNMITLFKDVMKLLQLSLTDPLVVLEEKAGEVTDTVSAVLANIILEEEARGHMLKNKEAALLDLEEFKERVRRSRFVVVVEDSTPGTGIIVRLAGTLSVSQ